MFQCSFINVIVQKYHLAHEKLFNCYTVQFAEAGIAKMRKFQSTKLRRGTETLGKAELPGQNFHTKGGHACWKVCKEPKKV